MTLTRSAAPRRSALAALAAAALLPLAACGGDEAAGGGSGTTLASLAPATSAFYAEGVVRPEGDQKADLDALIAKLAPGKTLDGLIAEGAKKGSGPIDFKTDVEPWLGERAAVAITDLPTGPGEQPDGAAIVQTTDEKKALATVRKAAKGRVQERDYKGTAYLEIADGATKGAAGIVEKSLVVGTLKGFQSVVDTAGGNGLDAKPEFARVVDAVQEGALGFFWGDLRRVLDLAKAAPGANATQFEAARELFDRRGLSTVAAGVQATGELVRFKVAATTKDGGQGDGPAKTLAALPAGSWAAFGLGDLGKSLSDGLDQLGSLAGPGFDLQSGLDQLEQQAGIDVQKDLFAWMGDAGLFVRGTSLTDIGGALVVQSKDPAATKAALAKARTLVAGGGLQATDLTGPGIDDGFSVRPAGAPIELFAALAGKRFVLAVNRTALDEAIAPTKTLADDDGFKRAGELLGDGLAPSFFLDFPKVSGLIGLAAGGSPEYAKAKAYLDRIGTIAAGSKREGDLTVQSFVVGLR